ncbi:MAG: RNA polymerase factor sigma-54 [bacterium]
MLSLHLKLGLSQKLSPQQIQYQKLLQLNTLSLEQRIKTELELNPFLEESLLEDLDMSLDETEDRDDATSDDAEEEYDKSKDEFDIEDYMNDVNVDEDRYSKNIEEERLQPIAPSRISLSENLLEQFRMLELSEEEYSIGEVIIQSLDITGYFKLDMAKLVDDINMFEEVEVTVEQAEEVLKKIQTLEPLGVGARTLQECLLIQIKGSSFDPYYSFLAEKVLTDYYNDFFNKKFDNIKKGLDLTTETLRSTLDLIQKLNPKPGEGNILNEHTNQITPDFIVEKVDKNYIVSLNDKYGTSVTLSQTYLDFISNHKRKRKISERDKEAHKFLREKYESAKWFLASIEQRRQTLMKIMRAIVEKQYEFFELGPRALRPMIYKDIAEEIEMDISTISRVVNGKYVQSPQGIHELKFFFSEGLSTDSGDEISNRHIRELIKEIVLDESKENPHSDDKIAALLQEKGIHIARRTVAKYREQLKLPVARLRKEL